MQPKTFFFSQTNKANWAKIRDNFNALLNEVIRHSTLGDCKHDFEIEVRRVSKKRSGKQLRSYWLLVRVIKDYMNSQGNIFTNDQVSDWVKINAGHYAEVDGLKIAKSIAGKSDATVDDMVKILEFMLNFGIEHNIRDCFIASTEYDEIINFYK